MVLVDNDFLSGYIIINNENSINFKDILNDYRVNFCNHIMKINTNFNLLSEILIYFDEKQLPHLMGFNKIYNHPASKIINDIDREKFTKNAAKKNPEWFKIKKRILNYNFLHRIFIDQDIQIMVYTSDMKPNRLHLDIVFVEPKTKEDVILGFRKDKNSDYFFPTTLHTESKNNAYNKRYHTKINKLEWLR